MEAFFKNLTKLDELDVEAGIRILEKSESFTDQKTVDELFRKIRYTSKEERHWDESFKWTLSTKS